jgi:xanthine dehydrogenase YagS FAD-binding subunit
MGWRGAMDGRPWSSRLQLEKGAVMAVIHDVMPTFELFQPASVPDALTLLDRYGRDAWVLAGGLDSFDWLKDRIKRPKAVIDLSGISELQGIRQTGNSLEIGAMTTLTEVVRHPVVKESYSLLAEAAENAASPQIRNQGTIGGNISQDTRCWYYRTGWFCYRAGGNICYADTPEAMNREHAILGADRCVAVNPSDTAPALIALEASMVVRSRGGERVVPAEEYFIGPGTDITRMTILQPGDLLISVRIPSTWAGARFYFEKVRDRNVWDFALVSVASAMHESGETIDRIRLAVNGVAARPVRLRAVEDAVRGKARNEETGKLAGELAIQGAVPLHHNAYKVPLMRNLVKRAIRGVEAA